MYCPNCQHTLPTPPTGQRAHCDLCGWVQPVSVPETPAEFEASTRSKAEEIARQQPLDTGPVWRYVMLPLGGLTLLVVGFNLIVGAFHKDRPQNVESLAPVTEPSQATAMPGLAPSPAMAPTSSVMAPPISVTGSPIVGEAAPAASDSPAADAGAAQPVPSGSPSPSADASPGASGSPAASPATGLASASPSGEVSQLPSLIPPSDVRLSPPPLPSPLAPSPRL